MWLGVFGFGYMSGIYAELVAGLILEHERHLSIASAGMLVAIPFALSVVGGVFAGWLADVLGRHGFSPLNRGRVVFVIGLVGLAVFSLLTAMADGVVMALVWVTRRCSSASCPARARGWRRAPRCRRTASARSAHPELLQLRGWRDRLGGDRSCGGHDRLVRDAAGTGRRNCGCVGGDLLVGADGPIGAEDVASWRRARQAKPAPQRRRPDRRRGTARRARRPPPRPDVALVIADHDARAGSSSHARIRSSSMPGAGLRQSLSRR